ncbi:unnamed protein product [Urochloa decumbens]|uniref:Uncharacterized protein n=1 Tax=Urochloa decumbens TaxID=240449 RepID=A0ABC9D5M4_9POAL
MASAMRGNNDGGAEANVKKAATTAAAVAAPKPVVINPVVARQITQACLLFSLYEIVMFAYVTYAHFSVDGPLWEAFAWSAGEAPLFLIPVCLVPMLRAELIRIYSEEPSDDGTGSDLSTSLLGHENV